MHSEMFISRSASACYYHNSAHLSCKNTIDLARAFVNIYIRTSILITCSEYHRTLLPISKLK
ncbi:hypothetical protein BDFB_013207 [Asbolus verrucosus]|uniref:Uncharacterized protein n=1 Tax=Asbolus verrucosus TaxID=1661398 RepID=A0A482W9U1_ASBVE|nr:hypothetical protein BDFB_013207 [Asbolus verrucosus]